MGEPLPMAAIPVKLVVLSLVQVIDPALAVNAILLMGVPVQTVCDAGDAVMVGAWVLFTVTEAVVVLEQPFAVAIIVNIVVCELFLVLSRTTEIGTTVPELVPVIFEVLSLVQLKVVPATLLGF